MSAITLKTHTYIYIYMIIFEQTHFYDKCRLLQMAAMEVTPAGTMFY